MSVGLLIISHDGIGDSVLNSAVTALGKSPLATRLLSASRDCEPEQLFNTAMGFINELDQGAGVLILTDLFGSTPSNVACRLLDHEGVRVVAGLNLPMLIRVFNYPDLALDALKDKALSGGRDGIVDLASRS